MKVQKTILELQNFDIVSGAYIEKNKGLENILISSIRRFRKQLKNIYEEYNDERDNLQLTHCLKDEKRQQAIMKDEHGNRQYSEAGEKALKAAIKELNKKPIEVHSRITEGVEAIIPSLTEIEKEVFSELVIPKQPGYGSEE